MASDCSPYSSRNLFSTNSPTSCGSRWCAPSPPPCLSSAWSLSIFACSIVPTTLCTIHCGILLAPLRLVTSGRRLLGSPISRVTSGSTSDGSSSNSSSSSSPPRGDGGADDPGDGGCDGGIDAPEPSSPASSSPAARAFAFGLLLRRAWAASSAARFAPPSPASSPPLTPTLHVVAAASVGGGGGGGAVPLRGGATAAAAATAGGGATGGGGGPETSVCTATARCACTTRSLPVCGGGTSAACAITRSLHVLCTARWKRRLTRALFSSTPLRSARCSASRRSASALALACLSFSTSISAAVQRRLASSSSFVASRSLSPVWSAYDVTRRASLSVDLASDESALFSAAICAALDASAASASALPCLSWSISS